MNDDQKALGVALTVTVAIVTAYAFYLVS